MLLESPEVMQLLDKVAGLAGETREEALRRALEERWARLAAIEGEPRPVSPEAAARVEALRQLRESIALTPEQADAWVAEIRAERMARRIPGDVDPEEADR